MVRPKSPAVSILPLSIPVTICITILFTLTRVQADVMSLKMQDLSINKSCFKTKFVN